VGFKTARFHVTTGPASLFERVRFKLQRNYELKVHPRHVRTARSNGALLSKSCGTSIRIAGS